RSVQRPDKSTMPPSTTAPILAAPAWRKLTTLMGPTLLDGPTAVKARALLQSGVHRRMEALQVLLQAADDQGVVCAAAEAALDLLADDQVFLVEHARVDQLEGPRPMRFRLGVGGLLGNEHGVDEQRLVGRAGKQAELADVVGMVDENTVGKHEMHQRAMNLRTPLLRPQRADDGCVLARDQRRHVAAHRIVRRHGVDEEGADGAGMPAPHVIDLEEGVDDQLPVAGAPHRVLAIEAMAFETDRLQLAVEVAQ